MGAMVPMFDDKRQDKFPERLVQGFSVIKAEIAAVDKEEAQADKAKRDREARKNKSRRR